MRADIALAQRSVRSHMLERPQHPTTTACSIERKHFECPSPPPEYSSAKCGGLHTVHVVARVRLPHPRPPRDTTGTVLLALYEPKAETVIKLSGCIWPSEKDAVAGLDQVCVCSSEAHCRWTKRETGSSDRGERSSERRILNLGLSLSTQERRQRPTKPMAPQGAK